jgi:hypothetical protein
MDILILLLNSIVCHTKFNQEFYCANILSSYSHNLLHMRYNCVAFIVLTFNNSKSNTGSILLEDIDGRLILKWVLKK